MITHTLHTFLGGAYSTSTRFELLPWKRPWQGPVICTVTWTTGSLLQKINPHLLSNQNREFNPHCCITCCYNRSNSHNFVFWDFMDSLAALLCLWFLLHGSGSSPLLWKCIRGFSLRGDIGVRLLGETAGWGLVCLVPMGWLMYGVAAGSLRRWFLCFSAEKLMASSRIGSSVLMSAPWKGHKWGYNTL